MSKFLPELPEDVRPELPVELPAPQKPEIPSLPPFGVNPLGPSVGGNSAKSQLESAFSEASGDVKKAQTELSNTINNAVLDITTPPIVRLSTQVAALISAVAALEAAVRALGGSVSGGSSGETFDELINRIRRIAPGLPTGNSTPTSSGTTLPTIPQDVPPPETPEDGGTNTSGGNPSQEIPQNEA